MDATSLQAIMLSIAEARSLGPILQQIVEGVTTAFDLALARLWLIECASECPVCASTSETSSSTAALHLLGSAGRSLEPGRKSSRIDGAFHRVALGDRKIGQIALSGPMLISELSGDEEWIADPSWVRREKVRSFAGHPLIFRGETLGVLAVFGRSAFSPDDFAWLRTFADHAAVAIANARAFEELDRLKRQLEAENEYLQQEIKGSFPFGDILGQSGSLARVLEQVAMVAETSATVLIQGESGTGKELIARAIHDRSPRRTRPFVRANCSAIPAELFESEFFGHVKGAFTGAIKDRVGRFELAHTGDLFLDEIGELALPLQAKLLRVLQEKQFERVGEARARTVDVRLIAATNRDLRREVREGRFREDLFYRLTVFPIELPPLRERRSDIPLLARHFLGKSAARIGFSAPRLNREQLRQLELYDWPGNVRELENVIERATIIARQTGRLEFDLPAGNSRNRLKQAPEPREEPAERPEAAVLTKAELRERELQNILAALRKANGKVFGPGGAAAILGMRPTTLASRMKALGIKKTFSRETPLQR